MLRPWGEARLSFSVARSVLMFATNAPVRTNADIQVVKVLFIIAACIGGLFVLSLVTAFVFVASPPPPLANPTDVFDFASLRETATEIDVPRLRRYPARDGEQLAYRIYDSTADRILIFIHGSSYHGAGYHALAAAISRGGAAKVVMPNLRGHYQSGRHRGDVEYIGQLEDDLDDLIQFLRADHLGGPITLGGHSSGGGLAIRFAGGAHRLNVSSYLLLTPIIPQAPTVRGGTAGGWANLNLRRLFGLLALNAIGIHGFNGLPVIDFNKPAKFWDGTETLSYSYRLNVSYHPRYRYQDDIRALDAPTLLLVGAKDEANDPEALRTVFAADAPQAQTVILPGITHFGIFSDPAALDAMAAWLRALPAGAGAGQ
jgi:non-heme chloroperoxidase